MYQTAEDIGNEKVAFKAFADKYKGEIFPSSDYDHYDGLFVRGDEKCFIEFKRRDCLKNTYQDTPIDYSKIMFLMAQRVKSVLLIQWNDCIGWININSFYKVDFFQRYHKKRAGDANRLHAFYLNSEFKII